MGYDPVIIFLHFSIGSSEGRLTQPPSMFKLPSVPSEAVSSSKEFTEIIVFSITCYLNSLPPNVYLLILPLAAINSLVNWIQEFGVS